MAGCWACYALTAEDLWSPCRHCGRTGQEPPEFSIEDLRMIISMCETACPFYPERDMYPAFKSVHDTATALLAGHPVASGERRDQTLGAYCPERPL